MRVDSRRTLQPQTTTSTSESLSTSWPTRDFSQRTSSSPSQFGVTTAASADEELEIEWDSELSAAAVSGTTTSSTAQQRRFELLARVKNALLYNELSDFPGAKTLTNLDIESFEYEELLEVLSLKSNSDIAK